MRALQKTPAGEVFQTRLHQHRERLSADGTCCAGSGTIRWQLGEIALHTDFGPADQDKDANQDYILGLATDQESPHSGIRWAIALADGVTSSFHAELGAELACHAAMAALPAVKGVAADKARQAIDAAGDAIGEVFDQIAEDPETYRPPSEFASTWNFALREGQLFQTTLSLAWLEQNTLHLAVVGDGGAVALCRSDNGQRSRLLATTELGTSRVHALGPNNRHVPELDCWEEFDPAELSALALFTDGVGRGVGNDGAAVFDELAEIRSSGRPDENVAERLIRRWIETRADEFEDNLSLAVVTWNNDQP